jgi:hypothetical protein
MASGSVDKKEKILCYRTTVTIPIDSNTGEATVSGLNHADEYMWCANIIAASASNAYSNCFIEYTIVQSNSITISVNRQLRNDTSTAITFNVDVIGVHM